MLALKNCYPTANPAQKLSKPLGFSAMPMLNSSPIVASGVQHLSGCQLPYNRMELF